MKKLFSLLMAGILIAAVAFVAPAGAGVKYIFQADLDDNTMPAYPAVLRSGDVTVDPDFVARIQIKTDAIGQTYGVFMQVGGPTIRSTVPLGSITTDSEGNGKASFDLKSYQDRIATPRIIGPYFAITSPGKPFPEFDTSFLAFPDRTAPANGRIIVSAGAPGDTSTTFSIFMSYGYPLGYPAGAALKTGDSIDSNDKDGNFTLAPGIYTINEYWKPYFNLSQINIDDPTRDSLRSGRTAIVNLAPGETVTVDFDNTAIPLPAEPDQSNLISTGSGGTPMNTQGLIRQSFVPTRSTLRAVELGLISGVNWTGAGSSNISIRESSPFGLVIGSAQAFVGTTAATGTMIRFVFASPLPMTPGNPYVIEWSSPGGDLLKWALATSDTYPAGSYFGPPGLPGSGFDAVFTTY